MAKLVGREPLKRLTFSQSFPSLADLLGHRLIQVARAVPSFSPHRFARPSLTDSPVWESDSTLLDQTRRLTRVWLSASREPYAKL
jgi:hypothetical protein